MPYNRQIIDRVTYTGWSVVNLVFIAQCVVHVIDLPRIVVSVVAVKIKHKKLFLTHVLLYRFLIAQAEYFICC